MNKRYILAQGRADCNHRHCASTMTPTWRPRLWSIARMNLKGALVFVFQYKMLGLCETRLFIVAWLCLQLHCCKFARMWTIARHKLMGSILPAQIISTDGRDCPTDGALNFSGQLAYVIRWIRILCSRYLYSFSSILLILDMHQVQAFTFFHLRARRHVRRSLESPMVLFCFCLKPAISIKLQKSRTFSTSTLFCLHHDIFWPRRVPAVTPLKIFVPGSCIFSR